LIGAVDCFQRKGRGSTGENRAQVVLRWSIDHTVLLQISRGKQVREERQRKRREIGGRRRRGFTVGVGIVRGSLQTCGSPSTNFIGLGAPRARKKREVEEAVQGYL
jgi:hypothetical protein